MRRTLLALALVVCAPFPARAQGERAVDEPPRNFVNLRVGASSADRNHRPQLCGEVSPHELVSIEGCGTGSGFLHREPEPELAHFRAKLRTIAGQLGGQWLELFVAAGFAELQIGADAPGFDFDGTDEARVSSAGPEAGVSLRMPVAVAVGIELLLDANLSLAWIPHAGELVVPHAELQPSASLSFGVGF